MKSVCAYLLFLKDLICLCDNVRIYTFLYQLAVNLNDTECVCQFVDDATSSLDKLGHVEGGDVLEDVEPHAIGSLLPDDENDLLAGIMEDFDLTRLPNSLEDLEDYDLFGSGGGMELESDPQESLSMGISKVSLSDGITGNGMPHYGLPNGASTVAGEHPLGEHPSRTLFVRNINSNVEDIELRQLFEVIPICRRFCFYLCICSIDNGIAPVSGLLRLGSLPV